MSASKVDDVQVDQIDATERLRELDEATVTLLASSIEQEGQQRLIQPITVRPVPAGFKLVTGAHRLEAARRLGWKTIPAIVEKAMSEDEARIREIDENVCRKELNAYDQAEFLAMRLRLWIKKNSKGNRFPKVLDLNERHENAQFYAETAGLVGVNEETVRLAIRRRRQLDDVWADLKRSDAAEKGVLLDRLRRQKANIAEIVAKAGRDEAGNKTIEAALAAFKPKGAPKTSASDAMRNLNLAWRKCPEHKRKDFVLNHAGELIKILKSGGQI